MDPSPAVEAVAVGGAHGVLVRPRGGAPARCALLVLAGSSGRVEEDRARLFARHGAVALSIRWFGGPGQPAGICEVPLETFAPALDLLAGYSANLCILGASKGAEAALLLAGSDSRVRATVALSPTDVVWANVGAGNDGVTRPWRSSWTRGGSPLPFVPYAEEWEPQEDPPAFLPWYLGSRAESPEDVRAARIPVDDVAGSLVLVAGGDDQVWDSADSARRIVDRRGSGATVLVTHPRAGHGVLLPGEYPAPGGFRMARGGDPVSDGELGALAWPHILGALGLTEPL